MLSTKNLRLKAGKLELKFIRPFKILEYISTSVYKLDLLSIYKQLHLMFYVSLLKEYITKKGQEPYLYASRELLELADNNKEQE